jgi:hypothetical protein
MRFGTVGTTPTRLEEKEQGGLPLVGPQGSLNPKPTWPKDSGQEPHN